MSTPHPHRPQHSFDSECIVRSEETMKQFARFLGVLLALMCMATGCRPEPELEVTITPSKVTIPDNSRRGRPLAIVSVRWSDGAPFRGSVRLTKNQDELCQMAGMQLQLGRDTRRRACRRRRGSARSLPSAAAGYRSAFRESQSLPTGAR